MTNIEHIRTREGDPMRLKPVMLTALLLTVYVAWIHVQAHGDPTLTPSLGGVGKVTLYARYDESFPALDNRILTTMPPRGDLCSANASQEVLFTLYPSLGRSLKVSGTVLFKGWLKADYSTTGRLLFTLYEVNATGGRNVVARVEGYVGLTATPGEYTFGLSGLEHTFTEGSTIQFGALFIPDRAKVTGFLVWNTAESQTQVVLPCLSHVGVHISAYNGGGLLKNFLSLNATLGSMNVSFIANVTNPFGVQDLKGASITLLNATGGLEASYTAMKLKKIGAAMYTATYEFNKTLKEGVYRASVNVSDQSGNVFWSEDTYWVTPFYSIILRFLDDERVPLAGANYTVINLGTGLSFSGQANASGLARFLLPPSNIVGGYNVSVAYWNRTLNQSFEVSKGGGVLDVRLPLYRVEVKALLYFLPLPNASVKLQSEGGVVFQGRTGWNGTYVFHRVPAGRYRAVAMFAGGAGSTELEVKGEARTVVRVESLYLSVALAGLLTIAAATFAMILIRKRRMFVEKPFTYIDKLVDGGLPYEATVMVTGPPASGKSILLNGLVQQSLKNGRKCLYITNIDFPSKVRDQLTNLGIDVKEYEKKGSLCFVDCYSGVAGQESPERHHVDSPHDVTRLGVEISSCLEEMGKETDVYYDSLSTVVTALKPDQVVSFIHATGAKIKGVGGRFCFTIGSDIQPTILSRVDETVDCVLELRMEETEKERVRTMRIKKVRGRGHSARWVLFDVGKKGIIFLTEKRPIR
ncbi:MAG: ATPase domain-containing protein [Candidatus Bathyarchaeia archaeon]